MHNSKGKEMTQTGFIPALIGSERFGTILQHYSGRLDRFVEITCALLIGIMVLVVWLGVVDRYFVGANITWTEEFSRYVMIWAALLSVSCGARRREHIGFNMLVNKFPTKLKYLTAIFVDLISILFFVYLVIYGLKMTVDGTHQYATIFGMTMVVPFAAVPVSSFLTALQILITSPLLTCYKTDTAVENSK